MKYLLVVLVALAIAFGFMIKHSNDKRAEIAAQAEAHKQKLEQERIEAARAETARQIEKQQKAQYYESLAKNQTKIGDQQGNGNVENISTKTDALAPPTKDANITKIEEKIKARLKDPMSAMFRNQKGNCGEVNAKNSFGGYTGYDRYIYYPDRDYIMMESTASDAIITPSIMDKIWASECRY